MLAFWRSSTKIFSGLLVKILVLPAFFLGTRGVLDGPTRGYGLISSGVTVDFLGTEVFVAGTGVSVALTGAGAAMTGAGAAVTSVSLAAASEA